MKAELDVAWAEYCTLRTEASKRWAEAHKLRAEAHKLYVEANKLWAEGNKLWRSAVRRVCGKDATIEWVKGGCIVMGIMEFQYIHPLAKKVL